MHSVAKLGVLLDKKGIILDNFGVVWDYFWINKTTNEPNFKPGGIVLTYFLIKTKTSRLKSGQAQNKPNFHTASNRPKGIYLAIVRFCATICDCVSRPFDKPPAERATLIVPDCE